MSMPLGGYTVPGVLNPGANWVKLAAGVVGVNSVYCEGALLCQVPRDELAALPTPMQAKPSVYVYDYVLAGLWLWPTPDRAYQVQISWSGLFPPGSSDLIPLPSPEWMAAYRQALAEARAA